MDSALLQTATTRAYAGMTDKYSPYLRKDDTRTLALASKGLFAPAGSGFTDSFVDACKNRMLEYEERWDYYCGEHFEFPDDEDGKKLVLNYCGLSVDKTADFFIAKGVKVSCIEGNEQVADFLNIVLEGNNINAVLGNVLRYSSITGNGYLYVTVVTADENGKALPKDKWHVRLMCVDSRYVHPIWDIACPSEMKGAVIQYPIVDGKSGEARIFTLAISGQTYQTWIDDTTDGPKDNPFGTLNLVNFPNTLGDRSPFGVGDLERLMSINDEINLTAGQMRRVMKYHAEPTTLIFGARVSTLEKGSNKLWSNLPTEARVENLEISASPEAIEKWLVFLKKEFSIHAELPINLLDSEGMAVSNTSGIAMETLFHPVIAKIGRKRPLVSKSLKRLCALIRIAHEDIISDVKFEDLADRPEALDSITAVYTSPLPRDIAAELDRAIKLVEKGIWSKAQAIREVGGVTNYERHALELAADARFEVAKALETARATQGGKPNLSFVFLSSPYLSEDLVPVANGSPKDGEQ